MNVPTAARAARASKTFDISDTSKGKHRPRAGIRRSTVPREGEPNWGTVERRIERVNEAQKAAGKR